MKKIIMSVGVFSVLWATNSLAQFQEPIKQNILIAIGNSNIDALSEEQLRFIIQDAVDQAVENVLEKASKLDLVNFLHQSYATPASIDASLRHVFSPASKASKGELAEATEKLRTYFTKPEWRPNVVKGLNRQIGQAIVDAYQVVASVNNLSLVKNNELGKAFLFSANKYLDNTVPVKKALIEVEDLLKHRIPMQSNTLVARTTSDQVDDILHIILKLF